MGEKGGMGRRGIQIVDGARGKDGEGSKEVNRGEWTGVPCDFHFLQSSFSDTHALRPAWIAQMGRR